MGILKLASDATTKLDLGEGDFLEVRESVSKKEYRTLLETLPEDMEVKFTLGQADGFSTAIFGLLVRGWSLPVPADEENYQNLEAGAAIAVDSALMKHFESLTPSQEERSKSKGNSK